MPLEKATQRFLQFVADSFLDSDDINELRENNEKTHPLWDVPQVDIWKEEQRFIDGPHGGIPIRLYWPVEAKDNKNLTLLVDIHGGAWVFGSLNIYDNFCRYLSKYGKTIIVSVDYRLAPEHKFPTAVDDCYAALNWVAENAATLGADVNKLCVGGDSAGGNLAAVMCHLAKRHNGPQIWKQLLFYPCVAMYDNHGYTSRQRYGSGDYSLSDEALLNCRAMYVTSENDYKDIRFSPILAESFADLPAALIIMPEYDPLRDEGEAYTAKLKEAGVYTEYRLYLGVIHGFMTHSGIVGVGLEALNDAAAFLRKPLP